MWRDSQARPSWRATHPLRPLARADGEVNEIRPGMRYSSCKSARCRQRKEVEAAAFAEMELAEDDLGARAPREPPGRVTEQKPPAAHLGVAGGQRSPRTSNVWFRTGLVRPAAICGFWEEKARLAADLSTTVAVGVLARTFHQVMGACWKRTTRHFVLGNC